MIVDIGTGDGRYVYRSARANPDRFYIGIDLQATAIQKLSERVHRKPDRGGLPNVLFVQAPVEDLPDELNHVADEIHVHFPWGSLLRAVAVGDSTVITALRRIAAPGAWLEIVIGIDEEKDSSKLARLRLPRLTQEYVERTLIPRYQLGGFDVRESGIIPQSQWPQLETTWAKRLRDSKSRRLLYLVASADD